MCVFFLQKTTEQREKCFTTNTKEKNIFSFCFSLYNKSTQLLNSFLIFSLFVVLTVSFRSRSKRKPKCRRFFYVGTSGWGGERERERDWRACISCVCVCFSRPWIYYDYIRLFVLFLSTLSSIYLYSK